MAMKRGELRKKYPEFVYKEYSYELKKGDLSISFDFEVAEITFRPKVVIKNVTKGLLSSVQKSILNNLVFHLGLAEMMSYWKATSSRCIRIEAGILNKQQIDWWHTLFMKGMGQYFYENKIDFSRPNFLEIKVSSLENKETAVFAKRAKNRVLVPIGGGKDAVVTYEILKQAGEELRSFVLNPKREQFAIIRQTGEKNPILVQRKIDPKLLKLNRKGYFNGHTPFSSYLAFLTVLCGVLFDYKYIALSNERSSNEGNLEYRSKTINHQYSKSFDFEKKFRIYSKKYLTSSIEYFSFLRPLYELQIAKLFTNYPQYYTHFLSCNEAHKTSSGSRKPLGKWCCKCAKCLFVFASLYPFVRRERLIKIFESNLFEDKSLIPFMKELTGEQGFKPFECVGTTKESLAIFYLCLQITQPPLPPLLKHFRQRIAKKHSHLHKKAQQIFKEWNTQHAIPTHLERELKSVIQ